MAALADVLVSLITRCFITGPKIPERVSDGKVEVIIAQLPSPCRPTGWTICLICKITIFSRFGLYRLAGNGCSRNMKLFEVRFTLQYEPPTEQSLLGCRQQSALLQELSACNTVRSHQTANAEQPY